MECQLLGIEQCASVQCEPKHRPCKGRKDQKEIFNAAAKLKMSKWSEKLSHADLIYDNIIDAHPAGQGCSNLPATPRGKIVVK